MQKQEENYKILNEMATSIKTLTVNMEYQVKETQKINEQQQKIDERLERIEHEPTEDYKHYKRLIIGCIITTVIGAVVGAILTTVL